ncbi:MAG: sodium/glutamate symporter [Myxococcota bacterium]
MTPTVPLNAVQVLALAAAGLGVGAGLKRLFPRLERLNVPTAIVGGLVLALLQLALRDRVVNFELELWLRDLLMLAFFTTIGFGARLSLLRRGGVPVLLFFGLAVLGAAAQNAVGLALAKAFGLHPLLGVASGSVALTGGPATALAFGAEFEKLGVAGASGLGLASAMFGIVAGGLLGGFLGGRFIARQPAQAPVARAAAEATSAPALEVDQVLPMTGLLAATMGLGSVVSAALAKAGVVLPAYVGAMLVAAVVRNLDDARLRPLISEAHLDVLGETSLQLFIVMALLTLQLWALVHLALPALVMLGAQVLLVAALSALVFRVMGRDHEAAVTASGYVGFMLGTTANAVACMSELTGKYGPAPRAWFIVPLVGAFLIDFANSLLVTWLMNVFGR